MGNDVSLQKFRDVTNRALHTGLEYALQKAQAMKLAGEDVKTQTASLEQDQNASKQRN